MRLSRLAASAKPSATLSLNAKAKAMRAEGADVVMFTVGEPDFDTPEHIKQAAVRALREGHTKYTPSAGTPVLRRAVSEKLARDSGLDYEPGQVIVSNGAKQALYMIMLCVLDEGDEVLLPAPYWVSYADQALTCGARPVVVDAVDRAEFKVTPELLKAALTERSKALVLNSPNNPTGAVYSGAELRAIVEVALEHDLWILSDEVYEKLIYDGVEHVSPAGFGPEAYEHTVTFNAVSKTYAMTGWRIGYAAGPAPVIEAAVRLQSNLTSGPNSIAQDAAVEALTAGQEAVEEMRLAFAGRRDAIVEGLRGLPGVRCNRPQGAFYVLADCRELIGRTYAGRRVGGSVELSQALLEEVHLAVVPGAPFGAEGHLRFSYAASTQQIEEGLARFARFIATAED